MTLIEQFAKEFLHYESANEKAEKDGDSSSWDVADRAFSGMLEAIRIEAEKALNYKSKISEDDHDSADQNALDTTYEAGVSPDSDAGRLIYYRVYVSTAQLL